MQAHLFKPLAVSTELITDGLLFSHYSQTWQDVGGIWQAGGKTPGSSHVTRWHDVLMGHMVTFDADTQTMGEFFVNRVTTNHNHVTTSTGPMMDVANRVIVAYTDSGTSTAAEATAEDSKSQAKYGIIEKLVDGGILSATQAAQMAETILNDLKEPKQESQDNGRSTGDTLVQLELLGYAHLFKLYTYTEATTGSIDLSEKLKQVIQDEPNGSIFSSDLRHITANTTQVEQSQARQTAWTVIQELLQLGDASYRPQLFGVYKDRKVHYTPRPEQTDISYLKASTELEILDTKNKPIIPADIRPGRWLQYTDIELKAYLGAVTFTIPHTITYGPSGSHSIAEIMARRFGLNT